MVSEKKGAPSLPHGVPNMVGQSRPTVQKAQISCTCCRLRILGIYHTYCSFRIPLLRLPPTSLPSSISNIASLFFVPTIFSSFSALVSKLTPSSSPFLHLPAYSGLGSFYKVQVSLSNDRDGLTFSPSSGCSSNSVDIIVCISRDIVVDH